ncbi:MAG TPA: epoxyqueuosine reductase [Spirochaetia bacterium]|nr:epoxyqueuosine reductase [Spirochaetia bacterium]
MKDFIEQSIMQVVTQAAGKTAYRQPLVGFARADDPLFRELKKAVGPGHLLPQDLLPEAVSVLAFFLPFHKELVETNKKHPYVAREWAEAYIETNRLISHCCEVLGEKLAARGVKTAWQQPTHNFDPEKLVSFWSHKHVAFVCGLGTFGLNHLLITPAGCAGRLGSLVTDHSLPPSPRPAGHNCLYYRQETCLTCVKRCPTGALTPGGLDKQKCYGHLLQVDAHFCDLGTCDVCGKCATGPCAVLT